MLFFGLTWCLVQRVTENLLKTWVAELKMLTDEQQKKLRAYKSESSHEDLEKKEPQKAKHDVISCIMRVKYMLLFIMYPKNYRIVWVERDL